MIDLLNHSSLSQQTQYQLQSAGVDLPLSLAVIAGLFVVYALYLTLSPLLEEGEISSEEWSRIEDESIALLNRRDRVIEELKDLEFEAAMNKIDDADLTKLKRQYEREALRLIEALDERASTYQDGIQEEISATREAARARKAAAKLSNADTSNTDSSKPGLAKDELSSDAAGVKQTDENSLTEDSVIEDETAEQINQEITNNHPETEVQQEEVKHV